MANRYKPKEYWNRRLASHFTLRGVGHFGFGEAYNEWLYRRKRRVIDACLSDVPLAGKAVLDIGCGTGFFVDWYRKRGAIVTGIDITDVAIERLRARFDSEFFTQDIADPDFTPPRAFDVVNMWDVIYHVTDPDAFARALDNVAKSLAPGGRFLFTDTFGADADVQVADHVRMRCLATYRRELSARGLEFVELRPLYRFLNTPHFGKWDDRLGGLFFALDCIAPRITRNGLALGVWRKPAGAAS